MQKLVKPEARVFGPVKVYMDEIEEVHRVLTQAQQSFRDSIPKEAFLLIAEDSDSLPVDERLRLMSLTSYDDQKYARFVNAGIKITDGDYIFDSLDEIKNLKTENLKVLKLSTLHPQVDVNIDYLPTVVIGVNNSFHRGVLEDLASILTKCSRQKSLSILQRLLATFSSILTGLAIYATLTALRNSPEKYFMAAIIWFVSLSLGYFAAFHTRNFFPTVVSTKYRIDSPGFFKSKGESVLAKIVVPVIVGIVMLAIGYLIGHLFGPAVPTPSK